MSTQVYCQISMSQDGFVAGPNDGVDNPMGDDGLAVHEWFFRLDRLRNAKTTVDKDAEIDAALMEEYFQQMGAVVMGRRMFEHGFELWTETPPWHAPVFVLTHRPQAPIEQLGGTTYYFVTEGLASALQQAKKSAGSRNVNIAGGASIVQQALRADAIDRLMVHTTPVLLGGGVRLFDGAGPYNITLKPAQVVASPYVSHIAFERTQTYGACTSES